MNAAKFERQAVQIAAQLEGQMLGLDDDDRETLGQLLGSAGRVLGFLNAVKSPALKEAGGTVLLFFKLAASLRAPLVGMGDKADEAFGAALPALQTAAPTVSAILRAVLAPAPVAPALAEGV